MIVKGALFFLKVVDIVCDGYEATTGMFLRTKKPTLFKEGEVTNAKPSYSLQ